jgi:hypothetical protein
MSWDTGAAGKQASDRTYVCLVANCSASGWETSNGDGGFNADTIGFGSGENDFSGGDGGANGANGDDTCRK